MKPREIFFCNLIVLHKGNHVTIRNVVYKERDDKHYHNTEELAKYGIKTSVPVVKVDVIKSLGFENPPLGFSEVTKADEMKRDNTTGGFL